MNLKAQVFFFLFMIGSFATTAQTSGMFNFTNSPSAPSDFAWLPAGALNNTFSNVDNTGLNISMSLSGATGTLTTFPGLGEASPSVSAVTTGWAGEALTMATTGFGSEGITLTITFSQPISSADFRLYHINGSSYSGDLCTVSALNTLGNKVLPTFTASANASYTVNYPAAGQIDAHSPSTAGDRDEVGIALADNVGITSITIQWQNCTTCGANFHGLGAINQFNFTLASSLPVELMQFDATMKNVNEALLTWATASETNNMGFEVEHALPTDGYPVFEKVAMVEGAGTTVQAQNYSYLTQKLSAGTHYFRLKQVDFDGSFSYSDIRALTIEQKEQPVTVYPNPVQKDVTIEFAEMIEGKMTVDVIDYAGQVVFSQQYTNKQLLTLDLGFLPAAYYTVVVNTTEGPKQFKLLKQ